MDGWVIFGMEPLRHEEHLTHERNWRKLSIYRETHETASGLADHRWWKTKGVFYLWLINPFLHTCCEFTLSARVSSKWLSVGKMRWKSDKGMIGFRFSLGKADPLQSVCLRVPSLDMTLTCMAKSCRAGSHVIPTQMRLFYLIIWMIQFWLLLYQLQLWLVCDTNVWRVWVLALCLDLVSCRHCDPGLTPPRIWPCIPWGMWPPSQGCFSAWEFGLLVHRCCIQTRSVCVLSILFRGFFFCFASLHNVPVDCWPFYLLVSHYTAKIDGQSPSRSECNTEIRWLPGWTKQRQEVARSPCGWGLTGSLFNLFFPLL